MKLRYGKHKFRVDGEVSFIEVVRKGIPYEVIVDTEFLESLLARRWNLNADGYARTNMVMDGKRITVAMHHFILPRKEGYENDHINRIRTDNRKANLRHATKEENNRNTNVRKDSTTGLKGVLSLGGDRGYSAAIQIKGKRKHLGVFREPRAAHEAYLKAVANLK